MGRLLDGIEHNEMPRFAEVQPPRVTKADA